MGLGRRGWGGLSPLCQLQRWLWRSHHLGDTVWVPVCWGSGAGWQLARAGGFFHPVKGPNLTLCCLMVYRDPTVSPPMPCCRAGLLSAASLGRGAGDAETLPTGRAWCWGCRCPVALGEVLGCRSGCGVCPWAQPAGITQAPLPVPSPPVLPPRNHLPPPSPLWAPSPMAFAARCAQHTADHPSLALLI